ncbi:hypothetical protein EVAR_31035_1 [Eumeta japonica]|uniref:Uncharacterized protein n=1 Tax=Eumeta variegata TaxID=151549 RepID=A0A4C1VFH5_EUMVA|nr:hypothetical protein EVAR_31035_1 [Eumeta japonica]
MPTLEAPYNGNSIKRLNLILDIRSIEREYLQRPGAGRAPRTFNITLKAVKKQHEHEMHTNKMRILRWTAGIMRLDKVRNEYMGCSFKITPVVDKLYESRMRWFGHVMRRDEDIVMRKALVVPEKMRDRGRPRATWWTTVAKDMERA